MGTALKHPVPGRIKPSFVIFDIRALWRSGLSVRVPGCQKLQMMETVAVSLLTTDSAYDLALHTKYKSSSQLHYIVVRLVR